MAVTLRGCCSYGRGSGKSKAFRWKEQAPEERLMDYISQWGKEPEKYVIPLNGVHSLARPVLALFTAEVLFLICFDRNVNCTCILPPPLRITHCVWILCIQTSFDFGGGYTSVFYQFTHAKQGLFHVPV